MGGRGNKRRVITMLIEKKSKCKRKEKNTSSWGEITRWIGLKNIRKNGKIYK